MCYCETDYFWCFGPLVGQNKQFDGITWDFLKIMMGIVSFFVAFHVLQKINWLIKIMRSLINDL